MIQSQTIVGDTTNAKVSVPAGAKPRDRVAGPTNAEEPDNPPVPADVVGGGALFDLDEPPLVVWGGRVEGASATQVISIGEPCILSGPEGSGKSYVALNLALAVGSESRPARACGLHVVHAGKVLLVSYEDGPGRIAARLRHLQGGQDFDAKYPAVSVVRNPAPLWTSVDGKGGRPTPTLAFERLHQRIKADAPLLIVIDSVSAAAADINQRDANATRACLQSVAALAAETATAVLLVASATPAAQRSAPSGPTGWTDGAATVLYLHPPAAWAGERLLECVKAKHGPTGWGVRLREVGGPAGLFGGFVAEGALMVPEDVAAWQTTGSRKNTRMYRGWYRDGDDPSQR